MGEVLLLALLDLLPKLLVFLQLLDKQWIIQCFELLELVEEACFDLLVEDGHYALEVKAEVLLERVLDGRRNLEDARDHLLLHHLALLEILANSTHLFVIPLEILNQVGDLLVVVLFRSLDDVLDVGLVELQQFLLLVVHFVDLGKAPRTFSNISR